MKIIFEFIKQIFMVLLSFSRSLAIKFISKCILNPILSADSNNRPCMTGLLLLI